MKRQRWTRTLVFEGPEWWIQQCKDNSFLTKDRKHSPIINFAKNLRIEIKEELVEDISDEIPKVD